MAAINSAYQPKVIGNSLGQHPLWPNRRGLETVFELHEFNDEATLQYCPNFSTLTDFVPEYGTMVDLGCGLGEMAAQFKEVRPDVNVIGVGLHDLSPANAEKIGRVYHAWIPRDLQFLQDYKGRVDLVTDTYGPMSFEGNPLHVMIYAALLLNGRGLFTSITSESGKKQSQSVLGTPQNWAKIKQFMKQHMDIDVTIIPSSIKSQIFQPIVVRDYLIRMKRHKATLLTAAQFPALCSLADQEVGIPLQGEIWWQPEGSSFSIREKIWP